MRDLDAQALLDLLELAKRVKESPGPWSSALSGKSLALLFEKTSTRTRASFEVAVAQLGGHSTYLDVRSTNLGVGALEDEVKCLARYYNAIAARVHRHGVLERMAAAAGEVPVINALSDEAHPCQLLGDLLTFSEKVANWRGAKYAWVGDGNNVAASFVALAARLGLKLVVATPPRYQLPPGVVSWAESVPGSRVSFTRDPRDAVDDADVVYTDTWVSLGQEAEEAERVEAFAGYQVNAGLVSRAKADHVFMHCLPAHRGREVTDDVLDSPNSVVFDQAENRLHAQKALLLWLLGETRER